MDLDVMELCLVEQEAVALTTLLESAIADLSPEIVGTDNAHYRTILRERRELLRAIVEKLNSTPSSSE